MSLERLESPEISDIHLVREHFVVFQKNLHLRSFCERLLRVEDTCKKR